LAGRWAGPFSAYIRYGTWAPMRPGFQSSV
jgi:hypothetical protein